MIRKATGSTQGGDYCWSVFVPTPKQTQGSGRREAVEESDKGQAPPKSRLPEAKAQ